MTAMDVKQKIKEQVTAHPVVLYMKGTPQLPQCGFSQLAIQILDACGVQDPYTVNVLADAEIRQGIKEYANWPTIPQRSEEHTSELQSRLHLVCRLLLEKKKKRTNNDQRRHTEI